MATTPNFSWVTPAPTDFVTDLPADFETFADAVDTDVWAIKGTADAALPETIIDAAGDLIYGSAADTAARLPIGTAGQVLKVNSGATAPEWGTAAAGNLINLLPTGLSIYTRVHNNTTATQQITLTEDQTYYTPIFLPTCTLDRIGLATGTTTPTAGNLTRLGIYNNSNGQPSTVVLDAGTVDPDTANTNFEITISQAITEGWYWLAINRQVDAGTSPNFRGLASGDVITSMPFSNTMNTNANTTKGYTQSGVTGAFATATGLSISTGTTIPVVWVRIS